MFTVKPPTLSALTSVEPVPTEPRAGFGVGIDVERVGGSPEDYAARGAGLADHVGAGGPRLRLAPALAPSSVSVPASTLVVPVPVRSATE